MSTVVNNTIKPMSDASHLASSSWRALLIYQSYRILIASGFITIWLLHISTHYIGHYAPHIYLETLIGWLIVSFFLFFMVHGRIQSYRALIVLSTITDIAAIGLLTFASGGIDSGLGILLIPVIAATGILQPNIMPFFFAATASLMLLGEQTWLFLSGITDPAWPPTGLLGLMLFISAAGAISLTHRALKSERHLIRQSLDLANLTELASAIVEQLPNGVLVVDRHTRVRFMNQRAAQLLGVPPSSTYDHPPLLGILAPQLAQIHHHGGQEIQMTGHHNQPSLRLQTQLLAADEQAILITLENVEQINARIQQAKLASLGTLAASIAHEIRNPLSSILHASQLLGESDHLADTDQRMIQIIINQSRRLDAIIEDVLALARRTPAKKATINLTQWISTHLPELLQQSKLSENLCHLNIHNGPIFVDFDIHHLNQILTILLTNARCHGHSPDQPTHITLTCSHENRESSLQVCDEGPGIDTKTVSHLFEPFFTTKTDGTGLGLYIARELAQLNGGDLTYIGQRTGACFKLHFPIHP